MSHLQLAQFTFGAFALLTAAIAIYALVDVIRVRRAYLAQPVRDVNRLRFIRLRLATGAFFVVWQLLMVALVILSQLHLHHAGIWFFAIFSLIEIVANALIISDIVTRRRALDDAYDDPSFVTHKERH